MSCASATVLRGARGCSGIAITHMIDFGEVGVYRPLAFLNNNQYYCVYLVIPFAFLLISGSRGKRCSSGVTEYNLCQMGSR